MEKRKATKSIILWGIAGVIVLLLMAFQTKEYFAYLSLAVFLVASSGLFLLTLYHSEARQLFNTAGEELKWGFKRLINHIR